MNYLSLADVGYVGEEIILDFTATDASEQPIDLRDVTAIKFQIAPSLSLGVAPLLEKTVGAGITIQDQTGELKGQGYVRITSAENLALGPGTFWTNLWIKLSDGTPRMVIEPRRYILRATVSVP